MEKKLAQIYEEYYPRIKRYVYGKTRDLNVSEDITHDVFLKVFTAIRKGKYKERGSVKSFVFTLAHNETVNYFHSMHYKKSVTTFKKDPESWNQIPWYHDTLEEYCKKETLEKVLEIIGQLPDVYLRSFLMVRFHDIDYKEVAKILDIPIGTVKSQLNFCKKKLKKSGFKFYFTKGTKISA